MNYPGGYALQQFHERVYENPIVSEAKVAVHLDVFTAMTGASRFGEADCCVYSKNESHTSPAEYLIYDWLITSSPEYHLNGVSNWTVDGYVRAYDGVSLSNPINWIKEAISGKLFREPRLPFRIKTSEKIALLRKNGFDPVAERLKEAK